MTISDNLEIKVNDKFNFGVVAGGTMYTRVIQTWQVLKIDEARQSVFLGKVGKDGKLLKANSQNMANVSFNWLAFGHKLGNIAKVQ